MATLKFTHLGAAVIAALALHLPTTSMAAVPLPELGATSLQWDFSSGFRSFLSDTSSARGAIWADAEAPATISRNSESTTWRTSVSGSNTTPTELLGVQTSGGATFITDQDGFNQFSFGIYVRDLSVDLVQNKVYGDLYGAYSLDPYGTPDVFPTFENVLLWDVGNVTSSGQGSDWKVQLSNLTLNPDLAPVISEVFQLSATGNQALANVGSYGTITLSAVPEPATYTLMGIGLVGIFAMRRRKTV